MEYKDKTKEQLIKELKALQQQVTELSKAEASQKDFEENFKIIFNDSTDGILIADREEKKFFMANDTICNLLGYTEEEIIGLSLKDIHPEADLPHVTEQFERQARGEFILAESLPVMRKDGTVFYADIRSKPIMLSGKEYVVGLFIDVTERKESENKLRMRAEELKESNIALKVLLKLRENDKRELEEKILLNIKHIIMPYIEKLKKNKPMSKELAYLNILESNIKEIVSPFSSTLYFKYLDFTPKEIMIANIIIEGKQDKDITELLNIAIDTVKFHRKNIRRKLGIYGKRTNLRSHLLSIIK